MIKIGTNHFNISADSENVLKSRMSECTCKTNLSPQLLFKQSYSGITSKTFVGNWTDKGFWISKFRNQLIEFRPDIIAKFTFSNSESKVKLKIRYSIGFSSIFMLLIIAFLLSIIFVDFGVEVFFVSQFILLALYIFFTVIELDRLKKNIKVKLMTGII